MEIINTEAEINEISENTGKGKKSIKNNWFFQKQQNNIARLTKKSKNTNYQNQE